MHRVKKIRHIEEVALDKEQQQTRKDILMNYTNYKTIYSSHFEKV